MRCGPAVWNSRYLRGKKRGWQYLKKLRQRPIEKKIRELGVIPPIGFEMEINMPNDFPFNCDIVYDHLRKGWYQYFGLIEDWVSVPQGSTRFDFARQVWFTFYGDDVRESGRPIDWEPDL